MDKTSMWMSHSTSRYGTRLRAFQSILKNEFCILHQFAATHVEIMSNKTFLVSLRFHCDWILTSHIPRTPQAAVFIAPRIWETSATLEYVASHGSRLNNFLLFLVPSGPSALKDNGRVCNLSCSHAKRHLLYRHGIQGDKQLTQTATCSDGGASFTLFNFNFSGH